MAPEGRTEANAGPSDAKGSLLLEAERARKSAEALIQTFCDSSPTGIVVVDLPSGQVRFWNHRARRILGRDGALAFDAPSLMQAGRWHWFRIDGTRCPIAELPWFRAAEGVIVHGQPLTFRRSGGEAIEVVVDARSGDLSGSGTIPVILTLGERVADDVEERPEAESATSRGLVLHIQQAREDERVILARQVHDDLGQVLVSMQMELKLVADLLEPGSSPDAARRVGDMQKTLRRLLRRVRQLAQTLRPPEVGDLEASLRQSAREFERDTGVTCTVEVTGPVVDIPRQHAQAVYGIVREALANVMRHAWDTRAALIRLEVSSTDLKLMIRDHGKGIRDEALKDPASLGLIGMRERAAQVGGRIVIERPGSGGTRVSVHLPF